jgi:hypothetical protein
MNSIAKTTQGTALSFLSPTSLDDALKISEILAASDFVPKDYQRKPGNILVAMQWGAEIGLQPLQAMQNIAVINGRPSVWGDAMLALVRGSGLLEFIKEELSENGTEATCTVKRKGEDPHVSVFTMEDAKKAGLSGKQGPWTQYPKRMLKLRARSYALRDIFPDVLKGMPIAEEEMDKEIDITPASESPVEKVNSGSNALKNRISKKNQSVDSTATEIDLTPFYRRIDDAVTLDELNQVGDDIAALNLGEPAKSQIGEIFKARQKELRFPDESINTIIEEINSTDSMESLNTIMSTRFEPFTSKMSKKQIELINSAYEAQEAALTP